MGICSRNSGERSLRDDARINFRIIAYLCRMESKGENEIIIYEPDDTLALDVRVEDESVWLTQAHDRFLIVDEDVYHIGASLKDLGKKLFVFSKMEVLTGSELIEGL